MRIFYSWQSDLPSKTNKNFIEDCLERAIKKLNATAIVEEAKRDDDFGDSARLQLDRDTKGVPGTPDVAATIFEKIANSDIFVGDVSIVRPSGQGTERPVPNPNVLIELGYALSKLGSDNIVLVMDTAHGKADQLPFDLRYKRFPISFDSRSSDEKSKQDLTSALQRALKLTVLSTAEKRKGQELACNASYDDIIQCILASDSKDDWRLYDETRYFKSNVNLRFQTNVFDRSGVHREHFKEDWATNFPDPDATSYWHDLYYGATLLHRFILISVDGARASLPVSKSRQDFSVSTLNYKVAKIHDTLGTLDQYMWRAGLYLEGTEPPSYDSVV